VIQVADLFKKAGIPVDAAVDGGEIVVRLAARVSDDLFDKYVDLAKSLGFRYSRQHGGWVGRIRDGVPVLGRYFKSYYYMPDVMPEPQVKKLGCYRVSRYKRASCEEYCDARCASSSACVQRCVERCNDEGWNAVVKVEEEVCLVSRVDGGWRVPRGLAKMYAEVGGWSTPVYADIPPPSDQHMLKLRDYQREVFLNAAAQIRDIGSATIQMATGAGKSYMAGAIAKWLEDHGYTVFVTAMQVDLVLQMLKFANEFGASPIGVTVQTLWSRVLRRGESLAEDVEDEEERKIAEAYSDEYSSAPQSALGEAFRGEKVAVILDEVHHLPARTVKAVMLEAGGGWAIRVGLSATPWRNDGKDLEIYAYCGSVVKPIISSSYLIQRGYAVPVEVRLVKAPVCRDAYSVDEVGASAYAKVRKAIVMCRERNRFIAELAADAEKPFIVVTQLISHADELGEVMQSAGLNVEVVTGAVKGQQRAEIYRMLNSGEIDGIVATQLAEEGIDVPNLRTMIIAMAGKSKTRTIQRVGRMVRPHPGKARAVVYELVDKAPFFYQHLEERLAMYRTEPAWTIKSM